MTPIFPDYAEIPPPQLERPDANGRSEVARVLTEAVADEPALVPRVSRFIRGRAVYQPAPVLPDGARRRGIRGSVTLHGVIGVNGRISHLQVLEGDESLVRAALDAVNAWRYEPSYLDGVPVEVETKITVRFNLQP